MSQVHPLKGQQREAVDPAETVWLSASAGTGKTQVFRRGYCGCCSLKALRRRRFCA